MVYSVKALADAMEYLASMGYSEILDIDFGVRGLYLKVMGKDRYPAVFELTVLLNEMDRKVSH